jgi:23S rRNA (guanine745-N1)-methyltransferase
MIYQCPLCSSPLTQESHSLVCENRHRFDEAKEGYVNLMPVQHKRSKDPGDNKEMTQARRRFLNTDHYHALRARVATLLTEYVADTNTVLDIGCGEGYYTDHFAKSLSSATTYGLDISKVAIKYAAKRYPHCRFCVASSQRLPFADDSINAIVRIYAPCEPEEMARCLTDGGIVITVTPAARHLYQFKERIYQSVRLHEHNVESIPGCTLVHQEQLSYNMDLASNDAVDLLQMTPFAWRAPQTLWDHLSSVSTFTCEADFLISIYRYQNT